MTSRSSRWVDFVLRYRRTLWVVALVLAIPAGIRTGWLYAHLHSELEELLPTESPSVKALEELKTRLGAHQFLGIVVDAGSREALPAAERFLDQLAARVRSYPEGLVAAVRTGNDVEAAQALDRDDVERVPLVRAVEPQDRDGVIHFAVQRGRQPVRGIDLRCLDVGPRCLERRILRVHESPSRFNCYTV